jgi:GcrA cell cycle regulator
MRADSWSAERIDVLKRLWLEGKSASAIAKSLGGVSRSAVLGKVFRLRLDVPDTGKPRPAEAKRTSSAGQAKRRQASRKSGPARRRGVEPTEAAKPLRLSTTKSLFELTNDCCRWPHGRPGAKNFFFCGASGADLENRRPYCAHHMQRAYIIAPASAVTPSRAASQAA